MSAPQPTTPAHPLVKAYLADLERALAGSDPREREEVLSAVSDHIDDALREDPTGVQRVLRDLGPVETIVAHTTDLATSPAGETPERSSGRASTVTLVFAMVAAALLLFNPLLSLPLATATLVTSVLQLRVGRSERRHAVTALVISALTLLGGIALALTLLSAGGTVVVPDPPRPA